MGYLRRVHGVTLWQGAQVQNPWSPVCQATSPNRDIPAVLVRPWIQNVPGKDGELSPSGYSLHPLESCPGGVTISPTLLDPVLVWKQQNYLKWHAVDREVFRALLGLLLPWFSPKEKRATKWVNEWVCRPTLKLSVYEIVFSLFAKSKCRIPVM